MNSIGITKSTNQDSLSVKVINTPQGRMTFAILCDGMGGLDKGEVASASKNLDESDMPPEDQTSRGIHKKGKIVSFCVLILLILTVFIVSGIVRSHGREENPDLPMESMPVEDEEDSAGTFSFE